MQWEHLTTQLKKQMIALLQNCTTGSWEIPFHTCPVVFLGSAYKRASTLLQSLSKAALANFTLLLSPFLFFSHYLLAFFSSPLSYRIPRIIDLKSVFILHACIFHLSASVFKLKDMWHPTKKEKKRQNQQLSERVEATVCNYDMHSKISDLFLGIAKKNWPGFLLLVLVFLKFLGRSLYYNVIIL